MRSGLRRACRTTAIVSTSASTSVDISPDSTTTQNDEVICTVQPRGFRCEECSKFIKSKDGLRQHLSIAHGIGVVFQCADCPRRFLSARPLRKHRHRKHQLPKFLSKHRSNKRHLVTQHPETMYSCEEPGYSRPFSCRYCGMRFATRTDSRIHEIRARIGGNSKRCYQCGQMYQALCQLPAHFERFHKPAPRVSCTSNELACSYQLHDTVKEVNNPGADSQQQIAVMDVDEGMSSCKDGDDVAFEQQDKLVTEIVGNVLNVSCTYCGMMFSSDFERQEHENQVRSVETVSQCSQCDKAFEISCQVVAHYETAHRAVVSPPCMISSVQCPERESTFNRVSSTIDIQHDLHNTSQCSDTTSDLAATRLTENTSSSVREEGTPVMSDSSSQARQHHDAIIYSCSYCGMSFSTAASRQQHENQAESVGEMTFCCQCTKMFLTSCQLFTHVEQVHAKNIIGNAQVQTCYSTQCSDLVTDAGKQDIPNSNSRLCEPQPDVDTENTSNTITSEGCQEQLCSTEQSSVSEDVVNYSCSYCGIVFNTYMDKQNHEIRVRTDGQCEHCYQCGMTCDASCQLATHFEKAHRNDIQVTNPVKGTQSCPEHEQTFSNDHLQITHAHDVHEESVCSESADVINNTSTSNNSVNTAPCVNETSGDGASNRAMSSVVTLDDWHEWPVVSQDVGEVEVNIKHMCRFCGVRFETLTKKQEHEIRVQNVRDGVMAICHKCNITFRTLCQLHNHLERVHLENSTSNDSSNHIHCLKCRERWNDFSTLVNRLGCSYCRSFRSCPDCLAPFETERELRQHYSKVHEQRRLVYVCELCGRSFDYFVNLEVHRNTGHKYQTTHRCAVCGTFFQTVYSFVQHLANVHWKEYHQWPDLLALATLQSESVGLKTSADATSAIQGESRVSGEPSITISAVRSVCGVSTEAPVLSLPNESGSSVVHDSHHIEPAIQAESGQVRAPTCLSAIPQMQYLERNACAPPGYAWMLVPLQPETSAVPLAQTSSVMQVGSSQSGVSLGQASSEDIQSIQAQCFSSDNVLSVTQVKTTQTGHISTLQSQSVLAGASPAVCPHSTAVAFTGSVTLTQAPNHTPVVLTQSLCPSLSMVMQGLAASSGLSTCVVSCVQSTSSMSVMCLRPPEVQTAASCTGSVMQLQPVQSGLPAGSSVMQRLTTQPLMSPACTSTVQVQSDPPVVCSLTEIVCEPSTSVTLTMIMEVAQDCSHATSLAQMQLLSSQHSVSPSFAASSIQQQFCHSSCVPSSGESVCLPSPRPVETEPVTVQTSSELQSQSLQTGSCIDQDQSLQVQQQFAQSQQPFVHTTSAEQLPCDQVLSAQSAQAGVSLGDATETLSATQQQLPQSALVAVQADEYIPALQIQSVHSVVSTGHDLFNLQKHSSGHVPATQFHSSSHISTVPLQSDWHGLSGSHAATVVMG